MKEEPNNILTEFDKKYDESYNGFCNKKWRIILI